MAARDIMPVDSALGGHSRLLHLPIKASQTFQIGEIVKVVATTGTVEVAVDEPTLESGVYIAAESAYIQPGGTESKAAGTLIGVYLLLPGDRIISKNYSTDAAGTAAVITSSTDRGLAFGFVVNGSGVWFLDTHTNTNKVGIIDDIVSVRTTAGGGLDHKPPYSATENAVGAFAVIGRIGRDFVAGAA
jgi:hypothetical protein